MDGGVASIDPAKLILLAPVVFLAHVLEEGPGFVAWFNSLVSRGISQELFLTVNAVAFVITLLVSVAAALDRGVGSMVLALAWLGLLMFANAVFHITATIVHARYCPGTITAAVLYIPYFCWFAVRTKSRFHLSGGAVIGIALAASVPMFVHGYLIVFKGSRLF